MSDQRFETYPQDVENASFSDTLLRFILVVPTPIQAAIATFILVEWSLMLKLSPFVILMRELYNWTRGEWISIGIMSIIIFKIYSMLVDSLKEIFSKKESKK